MKELNPALWGLILGLPMPLAAFTSTQRGVTAAPFLEIGPGARAAGMAEAFSAVADDAHAAYYNPAGLAALRSVEAAGSHHESVLGVRHEYAAVAVPLLKFTDSRWPANRCGVAAFSVTSLSVGGIERRSATETDAPLGTFSSQDFAYALSYAYAVSRTGLSLGATGKIIDLNLDDSHARGYAMDLGGLWRGGRLSAAGGIRHLGSLQRLSQARDQLPLTLFGGAAYRWRSGLLASAEMALARGDEPRGAIGMEYRREFPSLRLSAALRGGYSMRVADGGSAAGLSLGAGVRHGGLSLDFAWVNQGGLGDAFRYSLGVRF